MRVWEQRNGTYSKKILPWSQPQSVNFLFPVAVSRNIWWRMWLSIPKVPNNNLSAFPIVSYKPNFFTGLLWKLKGIVYINALRRVQSIISYGINRYLLTSSSSFGSHSYKFTDHLSLLIILKGECSQLQGVPFTSQSL